MWIFLQLVLLMSGLALVWQMEEQRGYRLEIMLDDRVYYVNAMPPGPPIIPSMEVTLVLSNREGKPPTLILDSTQRLDLIIIDNKGREKWRVFEERDYLRKRGAMTSTGQWVMKEKLELDDRKGHPLADGHYQLRAALTAQPSLTAEIAFEVRTVH